MRPLHSLPVTLTLAALVLTGCGGSGEDGSSGSASPSETASASSSAPSSPSETASSSPSTKPEPQGQIIDITIKAGKIRPSGERVKADLGKAITLRIDSDRAGELHVHSTPEQEIAFGAGKSAKKLTIEQPGIVDVEEHDLGQVIVQLQVS